MEMTTARRGSILVFCRFYLIDDFRANVAPFADQYDFHFLTDGHSPGTDDTRKDFYAALQAGARSPELDARDEEEIVSRCRYLRRIPRDQAVRQAHAMAVAQATRLDAIGASAVLCHMVDDYVSHVCSILAQKRGIPFVSYCFSYFPDLIQLNASWNGTAFDLRRPDDAEVERVEGIIRERTFRQNYAQANRYTLSAHLKGMARYAAKLVVFEFKAWRERDPLNLHYRQTPFIVDRRRLRDFPQNSDFSTQWRADLARLKAAKPGAPVVYLPLGYFPESTIDYWIPDKKILAYEDVTIEMLEVLGKDCVVLVKEHLHMSGARDRAFYRRIKAVPGVVSVHPWEYSNDVLSEADAVVVGGGSVGVEATIRGKPVFSFCPTVYWFAESGAVELSLQEIPRWPAIIAQGIATHQPIDGARSREFIRSCLASTVRRREGKGRWPLIAEEDLGALLEVLAGGSVAATSSRAGVARTDKPSPPPKPAATNVPAASAGR